MRISSSHGIRKHCGCELGDDADVGLGAGTGAGAAAGSGPGAETGAEAGDDADVELGDELENAAMSSMSLS